MTVIDRMFILETDLILNTLKHLSRGNMASAEWGARRLAMLGVLEQSNLDLILKAEKDISPLLASELAEAQRKTALGVNKLIPADLLSKGLPLGANQRMIDVLSIYERKAIGDIFQTGVTMIRTLSKTYETTIADALANKLLSGEGIRSTIGKVAKTFTKSGVTSLIDVSGKRWSIEGYSSLVVRSNTRQVSTQTQLEKFNEYGLDLVEISSHLGARPKCEPYQGLIFSRSGKSEQYPSLSSTSMGEIDGLFGINCGHRMYPYIPGTKKTYNPYPKKVNDKAYELSQEQRSLERGIRNSKRNIQIAQAAPASPESARLLRVSKENLKVQREEIKKFNTATGRTRRADRERIY